MTVYELLHGMGGGRGSAVGLYATRDRAVEDANKMLAEYLAVDRAAKDRDDPDYDDWEHPYEEIIWCEYVEPDFGWIEIRGQYGFQSYFLLEAREVIE